VKPDIEEWYSPGRNGLPFTGIFNQKGERVNNAPADAAGFGDDSRYNEGRDIRIHVHISCLRCHGEKVLMDVDDWVRATFRDTRHLGTPDRKELARLRRQYFEDFEEDLQAQRASYQRAFTRATVTADYPKGLTTSQAVEYYSASYHNYIDTPVTPARAARELGVPGGALTAALTLALMGGALDTRLAPFLADPARPIHRLTWESSYATAQEYAAGFIPVPADLRRGGRR
jgi:hypothetical protein